MPIYTELEKVLLNTKGEKETMEIKVLVCFNLTAFSSPPLS
jgi:hypothetical protein